MGSSITYAATLGITLPNFAHSSHQCPVGVFHHALPGPANFSEKASHGSEPSSLHRHGHPARERCPKCLNANPPSPSTSVSPTIHCCCQPTMPSSRLFQHKKHISLASYMNNKVIEQSKCGFG